MTAIDQQLDTLRSRDPNSGVMWQRLRVEAFAELVTGSAASNPRSPEIVVMIDWDTLRSAVFGAGGIAETVDGLPVHPATVRRMACDAGILPVVMGGDGMPLDVGRARRLATPEQRRALAAMYATCAHPDCGVGFRRCRMHHLDAWELMGVTNLEVLIPLCDRHHHLVHEGGWTLTMTPDRVTTWATPDGTHWYTGDTRDRGSPGSSSVAGREVVVDEVARHEVSRHEVARHGPVTGRRPSGALRRRRRTGGEADGDADGDADEPAPSTRA